MGARVTDSPPSSPAPEHGPEILFVCVHNAGRSQMAAGLVILRSGGAVVVRSAGSDPGTTINPLAIQVLAELGVDLAGAFPKRLTDDDVRAADVVVTMGCGDACPIFPGKRYEDWVVDDPAEARSLAEVRRIRDDIDGRVQRLLAELGIPVSSGAARRGAAGTATPRGNG